MSAPVPTLESNASPSWVLIVGISFLGVAVIFIMALIVASLYGRNIEGNGRFLVCALLALVTSIGSGFLGGSAAASGQIPVPRFLENPISFGITGGIAVFVIVFLLTILAYSYLPNENSGSIPSGNAVKQSTPPVINVPKIINVISEEQDVELNSVIITFQPEPLPLQHKLFVEIAKDLEFKQLATPRFFIDDPSKERAILSLEKPEKNNYWIRMIIMAPDGQQIVAKGESKTFKASFQ